eukprot:15483379-Alexandrium_andersonii.AAC.1
MLPPRTLSPARWPRASWPTKASAAIGRDGQHGSANAPGGHVQLGDADPAPLAQARAEDPDGPKRALPSHAPA